MERWVGKVALITGASEGIGASIAEKLVQSEMKVIGCARNIDKLNKTASKINNVGPGEMYPYQCDLNEESQVLGMFQFIREKFKTLHVCVNNAAVIHDTSILEGKTEEWKHMLNVNVLAVLICSRESVKLMRESEVDDGHIINLNSVAGHRIVHKPLYGITKFALSAINQGLRVELIGAKTHIRSTQISPGFVETYLLDKVYPGQGKCDKLFSEMECLKTEDISEAVLYVLGSHPRVNVNDIIIRPTEQLE
ncbi:dehydrogenase/reductase SDR family member 11-like [Clavelina lepadiformis]|uniref:Dehydrogenase/reductase SDR family member 11 n=1 Tax=Clavelina lepadiformis TaxID=159417 RepID=A0ABP0GSL7_CLALP